MASGLPEESYYDFRTNSWVTVDYLSPAGLRKGKDVPEELPRRGGWFGTPDLKARNGVSMLAWVVAGALAAGVVLPFGGFAAAFLVWLLVVVFAATFLTAPPTSATARDEALLEDLRDEKVCLIELVVSKFDVPVSTDRGVAWVEDRAVHFVGHGCSFRLGSQDLEPYREAMSYDTTPYQVRVRHPVPGITIAMRPLESRFDKKGTKGLHFAAALKHLVNDPIPATGPRQYPPVGPPPRETPP